MTQSILQHMHPDDLVPNELDPQYVDVIIRRWEKLTGEKAVKLHG